MMTETSGTVCRICNGTGIEYDKETNSAKYCRCGIMERKIQDNRLKFCSIPKAYQDVRLSDLQTKFYPPESAKIMKEALCMVKKYLDNLDEMQEEGKGLFLWSNTKGSGKTMTATALANELLNKYGKQVKFATSLDILDAIRSSYNRDSEENEDNLIKDLAKVEYLIIDDFGTERATDWAGEKFYQIVNKRYIEQKPTIFTSNFDIYTLKYDDRITNRIIERNYIVHFPEVSVREIKAKLGGQT